MEMENLEELRDRLLREERVQHMVRARAYEIYQMRGAQPGWESHDWFQAEGEVLAFLIADESRRQDDKKQGADLPSEAEPPAVKQTKARTTSGIIKTNKAAPKKTLAKPAASKKPERKPKAPRRSSIKEERNQ